MDDLFVGMFIGGIVTIVLGHVAARIHEWWVFRQSTIRVPSSGYPVRKSPGDAGTSRGAVTTSVEGSDMLERSK